MLDTLARVYDGGDQLRGVSYTLFKGGSSFVTAIGLRFDDLTAIFQAMPDYDTLAASVDALTPAADEVVAEVSHKAPWADCLGRGLSWGWRMTNQQGYTDGVRLEFGRPNEAGSVIVELVVMASAIKVFVSKEAV